MGGKEVGHDVGGLLSVVLSVLEINTLVGLWSASLVLPCGTIFTQFWVISGVYSF